MTATLRRLPVSMLLMAWLLVGSAQAIMWTPLVGNFDAPTTRVMGTKGVPDPANHPGPRMGSITWTGGDGNLYLYGGFEVSAADVLPFGDLWSYDLDSGLWTWLHGEDPATQGTGEPVRGTPGISDPDNWPGVRGATVGWATDDALYLWGGMDVIASSVLYQDMWRYDIPTNEWAWLRGPETPGGPGHYGELGVPHPDNDPGGRLGASTWIGTDDRFYLFGGGYTNSSAFNDIWRYDPPTNEWSWIKGSDAVNPLAVFGTQGSENIANTPAGTHNHATVAKGNDIYVWGGFTVTSGGFFPTVSECSYLWRYRQEANSWTFLGGQGTIGTEFPGVRGIERNNNRPQGGAYYHGFLGPDGNPYFFDGRGNYYGIPSSLRSGPIWRFNIETRYWTWVAGEVSWPNVRCHVAVVGQPHADNRLGSRMFFAHWVLPSGEHLVYGGWGASTEAGPYVVMADMWLLNLEPSTATALWIIE